MYTMNGLLDGFVLIVFQLLLYFQSNFYDTLYTYEILVNLFGVFNSRKYPFDWLSHVPMNLNFFTQLCHVSYSIFNSKTFLISPSKILKKTCLWSVIYFEIISVFNKIKLKNCFFSYKLLLGLSHWVHSVIKN